MTSCTGLYGTSCKGAIPDVIPVRAMIFLTSKCQYTNSINLQLMYRMKNTKHPNETWGRIWLKSSMSMRARTYIQQLCVDTGCSAENLLEALNDREGWRKRVWGIRADGTTRWWWWYKNSKVSSNELGQQTSRFKFDIRWVAHDFCQTKIKFVNDIMSFPMVSVLGKLTIVSEVILISFFFISLTSFYSRFLFLLFLLINLFLLRSFISSSASSRLLSSSSSSLSFSCCFLSSSAPSFLTSPSSFSSSSSMFLFFLF